jgi:hypothetical protein
MKKHHEVTLVAKVGSDGTMRVELYTQETMMYLDNDKRIPYTIATTTATADSNGDYVIRLTVSEDFVGDAGMWYEDDGEYRGTSVVLVGGEYIND